MKRGQSMKKLFTPTQVGNMTLPHRLAMAPMTRSRANIDGTPGELAKEYYTQRASMGLIISEGVQPSEDGQGYPWTPGIHTKEHVEAWKEVTNAVHEKGAYFFMQLMHVGRLSHPDNTLHHRQAVAPSAIAPGTPMFTVRGMQETPTPRALTTEEIPGVIEEFVHAAKCAVEAGADGVEIHGANGYLLHQFFSPHANVRTDEYGGSIENRARFGLEVTKAVVDAIGAERVGFRISPRDLAYIGLYEGEETEQFYLYLIAQLAKLDVAYLHVVHAGNEPLLHQIRAAWPNALLVNRMGRPLAQIDKDIEEGNADVATIGAWALSTPDFVERLKVGAPINRPDQTTFFGGDEKGYTDYPTMAEQ